MARYIDLDEAIRVAIQACVAVVGHGITQIDAVNIATALEEALTADVVPRAELAREIFREIRGIFNKYYYDCYQNEDGDECDAVTSYLSYVAVDFDSIEQKYTEDDPPKANL